MSVGAKTKIDWCDSTWNPVTGCLHGCEYCYARGIAKRFGAHEHDETNVHVLDAPYHETEPMGDHLYRVGKMVPYPFDFEPTLHRYKLDVPRHWKKPRTIFVCSMADLFGEWVPDSWIEDVFAACENASQHRYLFLTKNPWRYAELAANNKLPLSGNLWFGTSVPVPDTVYFRSNIVNTFVSIEPILAPFGGFRIDGLKWLIIGAETGNRKGKVVPEKGWIMCIANACQRIGIPIFMKESLRTMMGDDFRQEFPWEVG